MLLKMVSLASPWGHKTSPVTDPLLCDSREAFLEWNFSSINKTMKVEMTKSPYGLGPLVTNSLEKWLDEMKKMLLPRSAACPASHQVNASGWQRSEKVSSSVTKWSSQGIKQDKKKTPSGHWFSSLCPMTISARKKKINMWI